MTNQSLLQQAKQLFRVRTTWLGEGGMPSPHAQRRANICLKCPHNVARPWEETYKGVTAALIKRQLELRSKLELHVEGEEGLHMCDLCGCILLLKVHVPLHIARDNTPDWERFPANCWIPMDETSNATDTVT